MGYDLETLANEAIGLLEAPGVSEAAVACRDAGAPVAWMAACSDPNVSRLIAMEALIGILPDAEDSLKACPP